MNLIETKNLKVTLGGCLVLDGVDLHIPAGEMVGLIGPNGAGKSTLLKALLKLVRPRSGEIFLEGQPAAKISPRSLARRVAYLPQEQSIHWPMAVEKVVALGRIPHLMPWENLKQNDYRVIREAMISTSVDHLAGRSVDRLAGGEKTLVLVARTIASEPKVILADEPVAGLDPNHQIQVMQLLKDLASKGRGVLVVLHNLTLAARFCDSLWLLREGRVLACGRPRDVLSPDNLKTGYGVEARYGHFENEFYVVPWKRL